TTMRQNDATLEAVRLATNQIENIVDALLGHASTIGGALKNKKITVQKSDKTGGKFVQRVEEATEREPEQAPPVVKTREQREGGGRDDDPTVLSVRCVANNVGETGPQFTRTKKRTNLKKEDRKMVIDSVGPRENGPMPFEVSVKKTADPDWMYLCATVLKKDGGVLFVVETEANGDQLRNTRINGRPAVPDN
ncbi:hypothetical protein PFISCL1PPCAC_2648, partial [Pristionchus fissidentatus]